MAESSALASALALDSAALCFSLSERSSVPPNATETMQRIVSAPRTRMIENWCAAVAGELNFVH